MGEWVVIQEGIMRAV